jgi:hypothetical protein
MNVNFTHKLDDKQKGEYLARLDKAQTSLDKIGTQLESLNKVVSSVRNYKYHLIGGLCLGCFIFGVVVGRLI